MKLTQAVGAEPLVEVGPEVLGPLVEDALELETSLPEPAGSEVGASQIVVVQGGERYGIVLVELRRPVPARSRSNCAGGRACGLGPHQVARELEELQGVPPGRVGLGSAERAPPAARPTAIARSSRSVRMTCSVFGSRARRVRRQEQVAFVPDGPDVLDQGPRLLGCGEIDAIAEADQVGQVVERGRFLPAPRQAELLFERARQVVDAGERAARSRPRPRVWTASANRPSSRSFRPSSRAVSISWTRWR